MAVVLQYRKRAGVDVCVRSEASHIGVYSYGVNYPYGVWDKEETRESEMCMV